MKKYIKSSLRLDVFKENYLPEIVEDDIISEDEIDDCLAIEYSDLTEEDAQLFIYCIGKAGYRPKEIKKVSYDMDKSIDAGYDGGYLVTFRDGSSNTFGWYDDDTLRGEPVIYPIEEYVGSASNTSGGVTLEVEFEPYDRYTNHGVKKIRVKGSDLYQALCKMCDKMCLYLDSEQIEEEEMSTDNIIESIESSNGDGCDYIFYIKNISNGKMLLQGDYTEDE